MPDGRGSVRVLAVSDEVDQGLLAGAASGRTADLILSCGDLPLDYLSRLMNALATTPPRGVGDEEDPAHRGFACYHDLVAAIRPTALLHGHVEPQPGGPARRQLGRTAVRNVTGWHLLEIGPDRVTSLIPGRRRAI
jgi:hypothetical protein